MNRAVSPWLAVLIVPRLAAASGATEAPPPTHIVAVSAGLDLDDRGSEAPPGLVLDYSHRLAGAAYVHAQLGTIDSGPSRIDVRAGVEWRWCGRRSRICAVAGGDLGYAVFNYSRGWWLGDDPDDAPSGSGLIAASLGLEVGRGRVRARLYGDVALLHAGAEKPGWEASPRVMLGLTLAF